MNRSRGALHGKALAHLIFMQLLFAAAIICFPFPASASETIRVAVADDQRQVTLKSSSGLLREDSAEWRGHRKIVVQSSTVGSRPLRIAAQSGTVQTNNRSYRGIIELRKKQNGLLLVVNELDIEEYLKGVVAAEIPHDWEYEVLKAQAVASRTYALYQKRMSGSRPFHILATVASQVYDGRSGERQTALRAVRDTKDIVITFQGEIIQAFYHSSCGGHTENALELWGIDEPYLQGVDCECQQISRYGLWEKRFTPARVAAALGRQGYRLNGIREVAIDGITAAGRVKQVAIRDAEGVTSVPAEKFRAAIGYSSVPSIFFEAEMGGGEIVISGRGLGHGVGLCQWGAREMAQRGFDYAHILAYYYPGTRLGKTGAR